MSETYQSLSHSKWDCKYHVVFVPKRRRKAIFGNARKQLGPVFHALARQKECQIIEGHLMPDHVHMCIAIPPEHSVASVIGFLKGKSAIAMARLCGKEKKLHRRTLPGSRLCGINCRVRTGAGPHLHPRAGRGGWSKRTVLTHQ
jgi:REP element-mobilizing transposase RayT